VIEDDDSKKISTRTYKIVTDEERAFGWRLHIEVWDNFVQERLRNFSHLDILTNHISSLRQSPSTSPIFTIEP
jgi:hypothetical protein